MQIVKSDNDFKVIDNNRQIAVLQIDVNTVTVKSLLLERVDKLLLLLISRFRNKMYDSLTIELTSENVDLGDFIRVFLQKETITVSTCAHTLTLTVALNSLQNKSVKVIPIWLGERRKWRSDFVLEGANLVNVIMSKEVSLSKGIPCNTLIVINRPYDQSTRERTMQTRESVLAFDGKQTRDGVIKVVERENIGISYGAFSH